MNPLFLATVANLGYKAVKDFATHQKETKGVNTTNTAVLLPILQLLEQSGNSVDLIAAAQTGDKWMITASIALLVARFGLYLYRAARIAPEVK